MLDGILADLDQGSEKALDFFRRELSKTRTGRANPALLEGIRVDFYGQPTPINQMATVSVPENRLIVIAPWDVKQVDLIEKAIQKSSLDLNPASDGKVLRLSFPPLTEERRKDIVKQIHKMGEDAKIALRKERRDAMDILKALEKDGDVSEDDARRGSDKVQKAHDEFIKKVDEFSARKEKEVMEI